MKVRSFILVLLTFCCLSAMKSCNRDNVVKAGSNGPWSDWAGIYHGILPCANCEGIEMVIFLKKDYTYLFQKKHIGKGSEIFEETGSFSCDKNGRKIKLNGIENAPNEYLIGKNKLIRLDMKGKIIKGKPAGQYELNKVQPEITERYWKLVELNEKPFEAKEGGKEAHIILHKKDHQLTGNSGCNNLAGNYTIDEKKIKISKSAMTLMACLNMEREYEFIEIFSKIEKYTLTENTLNLLDAESNSLAKFEAVYLR